MPEADLGLAHRQAQLGVPEGEAGLRLPGRRWLVAGLAIVAASALPVLGDGYGADPDAWLVARAASGIWKTGRYAVSRFPGYPLHEILSAPLVGLGGCIASNAGTLAAALALTVLWHRIARGVGRYPLPLFLSLICAPLLLTNTATTMDYLWSLAFLLGALEAARCHRAVLAGICTGIAAGFRPSNLTLALPLFIYIALRREAGARYLIATAAATAVAFLPLMLTYGGPLRWLALTRGEMSDVIPPAGDRMAEFLYRSVYAAGPLACLALLAVLWKGKARLLGALRERDPLIVASAVAVTVMTVQFYALPLDRAYLIPAFPFVLLIADRAASPALSLAALVCILSLNVVTPDIISHEGYRHVFSPALRAGRLAQSWEDRRTMAALQQRAPEHPPPAAP